MKQRLRRILREAIKLDIKKGDVILTGRYKNKRSIVKDIGTDEYGQPTINGKSILKFKIEKKMPKSQWSSKSRKELEESKLSIGILRETIRMIIVELGDKELEAASRIADIAHRGQTRRDGQPYIMHPTAVQALTKQFYPDNIPAQVLAMIHDVIEDGPTYSGLTRRQLFSMVKEAIPDDSVAQKSIMSALRKMTHSKRTHPVYEDYLQLVFSDPLASIVKVSDLIHNLSHSPSERQIIKYRNALQKVPMPSTIQPMHRAKLEEILGGNY